MSDETMSGDFDAEAAAWMLAEDREPLAALLQRVHDAAYRRGARRGVEDAAETIERCLRSLRSVLGDDDETVAVLDGYPDVIRALLDPKPDPDQGPGDPLVSEMLRGSGEMRPFERGSRGSARGNDGTSPRDSDGDAGRAPEVRDVAVGLLPYVRNVLEDDAEGSES